MKTYGQKVINNQCIDLSQQPLKVLVIENDKDLCELLADLFIQTGFDYRIYQQTSDIIPIVKEFNPDLVLIDYLLPMINGGELCCQIKKNPCTGNLPVIIYSAFPKVLLSLGDYGCDAFIAKPFDIEYLIGQINKLGKTYRSVSINQR
ncbi:hypothetical protein TH53_09365 [Pedobacter lusitanus]|uniref:Response regulatory domain-containing protein n=1 Tax=Pedobacter lusitanus TaxID=1503925 RepID=A0A0D0GMR9_9SPHI|nr:response regulator [Pedobacter lusitanus]KIO77470.1 hypothetical protein TH53_09365 [Pedobacter lusitanus]